MLNLLIRKFQIHSVKSRAKKRYNVITFKSIKNLSQFKSHSKLKVFFHKGLVCKECGRKGLVIMIHCKSNGIHSTILTEDLTEMSIDHIIPKSKGGGDNLENLQPMCKLCNIKKADYLSKLIKIQSNNLNIGTKVFCKVKNKYYNIGNVIKIESNLVTTNLKDKNNPAYKGRYKITELYQVDT